MSFGSIGDMATETSFRAFKNSINDIIYGLPIDAGTPEAIQAIQVITQQVKRVYERLVFVCETIQARICADTSWVTGAAADVYEMLATAIDPELSAPHLPMRGALLLRNETTSMCQTELQRMMSDTIWNRGLLNFLGQLCTSGKIINITPDIVLNLLDNLILSVCLTDHDNFDHLMSFLMLAGPYLDSHVPHRMRLTVKLQILRRRGQASSVSSRLAIEGLLHLRARDWQAEASQDDPLSVQ